MERNFATEIEELGRDKIKELIVAAYQLQSDSDWLNRYSDELHFDNGEMAKEFLYELIIYMLNEHFMLDMAQEVIDIYSLF